MVNTRWLLCFLLLLSPAYAEGVSLWLSSEDGSNALSAGPKVEWREGEVSGEVVIRVAPGERRQEILGMGGSLDHATCANLAKLGAEKRAVVIEKLVDPEKGIGMNLMRLCIGASDFIGEPYYTYSDLATGGSDPELAGFSIEKDRGYVLPAIKVAQAKNPELLFFASPWSPPGWMKRNGALGGGRLVPENYGVYARYLIRYLEAYQQEGIAIYALTPQNEPLMGHQGYPTCLWTAEGQRDFIREHLGPRLAESGLPTRIWCWDHNWNYLKFPRTILEDAEAARYVDGVAFHLYEGKVDAQSALHAAYPGVDIFFTEGSTFRTRGAIQIIEIFRHWARSYNAWVLLLDEARKPNSGPHAASPTCIELQEDGSVSYRFDYYMYGQFMKYIPRGSVCIGSDAGGPRFANVAFLRPDGQVVLVVANADRKAKVFSVVCGARHFESCLPSKSVGTYLWPLE